MNWIHRCHRKWKFSFTGISVFIFGPVGSCRRTLFSKFNLSSPYQQFQIDKPRQCNRVWRKQRNRSKREAFISKWNRNASCINQYISSRWCLEPRRGRAHIDVASFLSLSLILSFCICRAIQTENEIRYFTKRRISLQIIHHTQETKKNMSISLASSFYFYLICSSIESMNFATKFPFHFFCLMNDGAKKRVSSLSFSICRNSCREIRSSLFKSKLAMIS